MHGFDREFLRLQGWVRCSSITLIVLGVIRLIASIDESNVLKFLLLLGGGLFFIGTGVIGLMARNNNDMGQTKTFKHCLIVLLFYNIVLWFYTLGLALTYPDDSNYFIRQLVAQLLFLGFVVYVFKVTLRLIEKYQVLYEDRSYCVYASELVGPPPVYPGIQPPAGYQLYNDE